MTDEQLDEIEKLAEAATPGPWVLTTDWSIVQTNHVTRDVWTIPRSHSDLQYIVAMREHALPLVKALREAQAALDQVSSDDRMSEAQITAAITEAQKERDAARNRLSHLLARIHRDGGHYEIENGTEKATEDAEKIVVEDRQAYVSWRDTALATAQERDEARAEVERLREAAMQIRLELIDMRLVDGLDAIDKKRRKLFEITKGMVE